MSRAIVVHLDRPDPPGLARPLPPHTEVIDALASAGYEEIALLGLRRYQTKFRDGEVRDELRLDIDPDAEFLVCAWHYLPAALEAPRPSKHWAYVGEGIFEITAILRADDVLLRIGEYRKIGWLVPSRSPFRSPSICKCGEILRMRSARRSNNR